MQRAGPALSFSDDIRGGNWHYKYEGDRRTYFHHILIGSFIQIPVEKLSSYLYDGIWGEVRTKTGDKLNYLFIITSLLVT